MKEFIFFALAYLVGFLMVWISLIEIINNMKYEYIIYTIIGLPVGAYAQYRMMSHKSRK